MIESIECASPTQLEIHARHRALRQRLSERSVPDDGIDLRRSTSPAAATAAGVVPPPLPPPQTITSEHDIGALKLEIAALKEHCADTTAQLTKIVRALFPSEPANTPLYPTMGEVLAVTTSFYGVTVTRVRSAQRSSDIIRPRQVTMFLMREMTPQSLPAIGRFLGGRDHTTVLHAIARIKSLCEQDERLRHEVEVLRLMITESFLKRKVS